MKTTHKLTAILLALAMLTALFILPASAADGTNTGAAEPVFVTDGDRLVGIDFSGVIRDAETLNTGKLTLVNENNLVYRFAQFDAQQPGVAILGIVNSDGVFTARPYIMGATDDTLCLRPQEQTETLYDDVVSFTFAAHDVFAGVAEASVRMLNPTVKVTKADGELVREMQLSFGHVKPRAPMLLDCADLQKSLTFTVSYADQFDVAAFTLQPTAYDAEAGILTVSVQNADGREGCSIYDCGCKFNEFYITLFLGYLHLPEGLLYNSENNRIRSAETTSSCGTLHQIDGMPSRVGAQFTIPSRILTIAEKASDLFKSPQASVAVGFALLVPVFLFQTPAIFRAVTATVKAINGYGFKWTSVNWFRLVADIIKNIDF